MADIIKKVTDILNGKDKITIPAILSKWQNIYYNTSVHTTGVCPSYYPLRYENVTRIVTLGTSAVQPIYWIYPQYDIVFERLFGMHPREPEILRELRKSLYKPYQQAPLTQAMDKCKAIISAENKYTLIVDDQDDNAYIWGNNFDGKNLVDFIFWHWKAICEDPNSLFLVTTDRPAKEMKSGKVTCKIMHIPTRRMYYPSADEIIFYETDDLIWYINGASYLRFERDGSGNWAHMDGRSGYYAHMLGRLPCHCAGGVWNTHGFYDSYLQPAIPFCDELVGARSDLQMINKESAHPIIIEASVQCPDCAGLGTYQFCRSCNCRTEKGCTCHNPANYNLTTCDSCHGSKQQSHNPGQRMLVPPEMMGNDLAKFINPDIAINQYHVDYSEGIYEGIRAALHQQTIKEAQSGTAKEIDRDGERLWYQTCSNGMWSLIENILIDILSLRNISKSDGQIKPNIPKYTLIPPTEFDLKSEFDLLEEYKEATDSKMPDYIRQYSAMAYVDKSCGGDEVMVKKSNFINYIDPYSVTTATDKDLTITSGVASVDQIRYSNELPVLLNKLIYKKGKQWFINADFDDIETEIKAMFAKLPVPEIPKDTTVVKANI